MREWLARLRDWFRRDELDGELAEELRFHREHLERDLGPEGAGRLGNVTRVREESRDRWSLAWLDMLQQDLRYALRGVRRTPAFTITVVITLGLGLGANAAMFTVLDTLYLRPPSGIERPGGLRRVWVEHFHSADGVPFKSQALNVPLFRVIARAVGDSNGVALYRTENALTLGRGPGGPTVRAVYATANYFGVLGVRPVLGRSYTTSEDRFGASTPVAVVSHAFWQRQLGGTAAALGSELRIGRATYTVIGVLDPAFTGLDLQAADVWIPFAAMPAEPWMPPAWWESINLNGYRAVVRWPDGLGAGDFERRASLAVREFNRQTQAARPDTQMNVYAGGIIEARGPARPGQELVISTRLSGVAVIVLLIAWANVMNLLLARATQRRREIALRLALGISRGRLVRLLTLETMVLAVLAAGAALLIGGGGGAALRHLLLPDIVWARPVLDARVLLFTGLVAVTSGLVAGLVPAFQSSRLSLTGALKSGAPGGGRQHARLRGALVAAQAALSVVLLVGATLFVRSLRNVQALDIGYDADRLLFGDVRFADGARPPRPVVAAGSREVVQQLEGRPGIEAVARSAFTPMQGLSWIDFYSGADSAGSFAGDAPTMTAVSAGYFRATGIRLLRGTAFRDGGAASPPDEIVVNDAAARLLWPGREALGQCVRFRTRDGPCYTVSGVVETVRLDRVIEARAAAQIYLPLGNAVVSGWSGGTIIVRARAGAGAAAAAALTAALKQAFPTGEPRVTSMTENLEPEYRPWRLGASLFTAFGLLALGVALVGIYSTVSYSVTQRSHEFGVRVALGASLADILRQVVGEGLRTVALGVAAGVALALAAGRLVAALLFGVTPGDPAALVEVSAVLLAVSALAALLPAWRAARADPVVALRAD